VYCLRVSLLCLTHSAHRDVVFQSNPFHFDLVNAHPSSQPVVFAAEESSHTLGTEHWNSQWIRDCYGPSLHHLHNATISCSGTTIGPLSGMLAYLDDMCFEISRTQFVCNDQGNHNFVIHHKYLHLKLSTFPFTLEPNDVSPLYTVGLALPSALPFHWNGSRIVRNSGARPLPPVVHQLQIFQPWNDVLGSLGLIEHSVGAVGQSHADYFWAGPPYACVVGCGNDSWSMGHVEVRLPSAHPGVKVRAKYSGFQFCMPALAYGPSMWDG
jgi:hypothetical protein